MITLFLGGDLSSEPDDVAGSRSVLRDVGTVAEDAAVVASRALLRNVSLGPSEGLRQRRRYPSTSGASHSSTTTPSVALRADVDAQPKRLATVESRLMDGSVDIVIIRFSMTLTLYFCPHDVNFGRFSLDLLFSHGYIAIYCI